MNRSSYIIFTTILLLFSTACGVGIEISQESPQQKKPNTFIASFDKTNLQEASSAHFKAFVITSFSDSLGPVSGKQIQTADSLINLGITASGNAENQK